ncbi:MAG: type I-U CRISPR-associated protein Csb2 [Planctomycetota bacterium]|nr:type I-U CRISPR-associated protein Csb2 [Planctomycetota bacterium]
MKLHLRFLTNRCVATRIDARERAEWPPHPGRVFMALAAAHFETDASEQDQKAERAALDWLSSLPAPRIYALESVERRAVTFYVPVNDAPQPNKAMLQSAPGLPRSRQSRSFPTVIPQRGDGLDESTPDVTFEWADTVGTDEHLSALGRLCANVIRVGHSSSLVMAWVESGNSEGNSACWEPTDSRANFSCRIATTGELERLQAACGAERIDLFAQLSSEIGSTKGNEQKAAKERFKVAFGQPFKTSLRPPEPTPATLGVWQGYRRRTSATDTPQEVHLNTYFERDLLILEKQDGPALNVERTLGLTQALRQTLISVHDGGEMPAWLSGHEPDGSPASTPHAAFLSLPYAGYEHADGHLMGLAIALPRGISAEERGRWLGPLLVNQESGEPSCPSIRLWGRDLPDWTVQLEQRPSPPLTLQNSSWTKPTTTWASVTPVVLDRFPNSSRGENRDRWHAEVIEIVKLACSRAGLPEPVEIDVDSTAWHRGVPRAWTKTRRRRGVAIGSLGDGFPAMPAKPSRPPRPQVHVWLRFDRLVAGPVLIGAGRFLGYGLCKPVSDSAAKKELTR